MLSEDTLKLELFGILAADPDKDLRLLVQKLNTPLSKLNKWKKQFEESKEQGILSDLISMDDAIADEIIDKATDTVVNKIEYLESILEDDDTYDYNTVREDKYKRIEELDTVKKLAKKDFKSGLKSIKDLSSKTETAANDLIDLISVRIRDIAEDDGIIVGYDNQNKPRVVNNGTKDLLELSQALANIRNAYFNKPTTNIQVNQIQGGMLEAFRNNLKP